MSFIQNFITGAKIVFSKMQTKEFWVSFLKVALPFFVVVTVISLFLNSWRDIFAGDFAAVSELNFKGDQWKSFWGIKIFISVFYGLYMTIKNIK